MQSVFQSNQYIDIYLKKKQQQQQQQQQKYIYIYIYNIINSLIHLLYTFNTGGFFNCTLATPVLSQISR